MTNQAVSSHFSYFLVNKRALRAIVFSLVTLLAACSGSGLSTEAEYKDKQHEEMYKYGSLASENGGFSLLGGDEKKVDQNGLGVNGYLWRASLDTISFMPITSADAFGGTIITDWYSAPNAPNERAKVNVFILDRELRADGVKVTVFRQTKETSSDDWTDAPVNASTASQLEETILTRARQLKLAKRERK
ncbi:MAG: DUF3576 domain-containing protein [Alphaproteobacteria bacterium]|nr:DUF3576 domain-containing protein [Alphaproteobacteria bacterium]